MCGRCGCEDHSAGRRRGALGDFTRAEVTRAGLGFIGVEPARGDGPRLARGSVGLREPVSLREPVGERATLELESRVLAKNDALAARNRAWFDRREILALNLMSSPGSGKTTLLVKTIRDLRATRPIYVIEGDQATSRDADRIRETGASAVQLNTGAGCHLDAEMIARGVGVLRPAIGGLVMIENVGNLVCPAMFDLGERAKVAILSVTEGDDKPLKYPHMFRAAQLMLINKLDLLPHVEFDVAAAIAHARQVNPSIIALGVSAKTGEGMTAWYAWLEQLQHGSRRSLLA